jgi:hypothetical protein
MTRTLFRSALLLPLAACIVDYEVAGISEPVLDAPAEPAPEVASPVSPEPEVVPDAPTDDDPPPADDCAYTADGIYALARDGRELYLFDPGNEAFDYLGDLDCAPFGSPNSMGVGRDGVAYVRWSDDTVYEVHLPTLRCRESDYRPGTTRFGPFGMGYATDDAQTWRDKLYVANATTLAHLDTTTWQLQPVGPLPSQSELTGNADGELWAFLPLESPVELRRVDQASGATVETLRVTGFPSPRDIDTFAFAAWGGELWAFVRRYGVGSSTDVYQIDASGRMSVVATRIGINAVGAGVSTCASTD